MRTLTDGALGRSASGFSKELAAPVLWLLLWLAIMQPTSLATLWGMGYAAIVAWLGYALWTHFGGLPSFSRPKQAVSSQEAASIEPAPIEELVQSGVDASKVFEATIVLQRLEDRGIARGMTLSEVLEVLGYLTPRNPQGTTSTR